MRVSEESVNAAQAREMVLVGHRKRYYNLHTQEWSEWWLVDSSSPAYVYAREWTQSQPVYVPSELIELSKRTHQTEMKGHRG